MQQLVAAGVPRLGYLMETGVKLVSEAVAYFALRAKAGEHAGVGRRGGG